LADHYGIPVGFSDHSIDINTPVMAVEHYGCEVLEKHVNFCGATGPDAPHSVDEGLFEAMINRLWGEEDGYDEEADMFKYHNKRLVVTENLEPGDTLHFGRNFGYHRSRFVAPHYSTELADFDKKKVAEYLKRGESLKAEHLA
jgi:sialic acid synthase SpsE